MNRLNKFEEEGDGSEDDGTLYSLSSEFLESAYVLHNTPPTKLSYSLVIYYLLGHSAELMLKAFLYKKGKSIVELKSAGHNLQKLIIMAKNNGLKDSLELMFTEQLANIYKDKELEYRKNRRKEFPNIENLFQELKKLQSTIFNNLF